VLLLLIVFSGYAIIRTAVPPWWVPVISLIYVGCHGGLRIEQWFVHFPRRTKLTMQRVYRCQGCNCDQYALQCSSWYEYHASHLQRTAAQSPRRLKPGCLTALLLYPSTWF
jgi:hypothetical protein